MVQHLLRKHEVLSSNPRTVKKKKSCIEKEAHLEARGLGGRRWGQGEGGRNDPNNVYTCE
jgi:hypothetical protein